MTRVLRDEASVSTLARHYDKSFAAVQKHVAVLERAWQIWVDPRQLERWWGPPTWPATFVQHDVVVDGSSSYYMTGPHGEKAHGWWCFLSIDEPRSLEFEGMRLAMGQIDDILAGV